MGCPYEANGWVIYRCTMSDEIVAYSFLTVVTVAGLGLLTLAFV